MAKLKRCPIGERRRKGKCIIKKGQRVGIKGEPESNVRGWEGKIVKHTAGNYYLVKGKDTQRMEEVNRREIITDWENRRL